MNHTYHMSGMPCQSCVEKTTAALEGLEGVTSAKVTLNPPQARIEMTRHLPTETLNQALRAVGDYQVGEEKTAPGANVEEEPPTQSLYPLFLILAYVAGTVSLFAFASGTRSLPALMNHFMGGFFLVFSFFKLLDLRGFADAYRSYDILAGAWPLWGFVYPFIELALGVTYLLSFSPVATNFATLALMLVGAVGVLKSLLNKRAVRCACLGTVLKLPMTKVTLIEELGMAAMAGAMLAFH